MPRRLTCLSRSRVFGATFLIVFALALATGSCGKSPTQPPPPPPQLPEDPSTTPPPLRYVNHFSADTQWVAITPTADGVEIKDIQLSFQYEVGYGWVPMYTRLTGGPVIPKNGTAVVEVVSEQGGTWPPPRDLPVNVNLRLNIRRTPYRTWFAVRVE